MKTSDYTIEDLVQGAILCHDDNEIEVQGMIGKAIMIVFTNGNVVGSFTLELLKNRGYQLIKPIKMNGDFEVKKYEKPYPEVSAYDKDFGYCTLFLHEVKEKEILASHYSNVPPFKYNYKISKIEGQKY